MTEEEKPKRGRKPKPKFDMVIGDEYEPLVKRVTKFEWFESLANQYNIGKFEYLDKFKAFRVYANGSHVDWVSLNDLAMLNGKQPQIQEKLKYAPIPKARQLIKMNWRQ